MVQEDNLTNETAEMANWESPHHNFTYLLFERVEPVKNANRFYYLAWLPTLLYPSAVVRMYGRKGETQRMIQPQPFDTLDDAWPLVRSIIRVRLNHGYRIVQPREYAQIKVHNFDTAETEAIPSDFHKSPEKFVVRQLELIPLDAIAY